MHWLRSEASTEARRLLRVLFLRLSAMSADTSGALRRNRHGGLLSLIGKWLKQSRARYVAQPAHAKSNNSLMPCTAVSARAATKAHGVIHPNDWAPVHESIAGPVIFVLRRISGMHQLYLETS